MSHADVKTASIIARVTFQTSDNCGSVSFDVNTSIIAHMF